MSKIYVVATPIGNLGDITQRAIETLGQVDFILAEDTRVTKKLLSHLGISKPVERLDDNISEARISSILASAKGKEVALVTDAGTPNISDPGWRLVAAATEKKFEIIPIPGASALTTSRSITHFPTQSFIFVGFPPAKRKREKFFSHTLEQELVVVMYESPHRIIKTLANIANLSPRREALVAKELTKIHERLGRGGVQAIYEQRNSLAEREQRGEYVVVRNATKLLKSKKDIRMARIKII